MSSPEIRSCTMLAILGVLVLPASAHAGGGAGLTAQEIVLRAQAAGRDMNTYHRSLWSRVRSPGELRLVFHGEDDVTLAPFALRSYFTTRVVNPTGGYQSRGVQPSYYVLVNGQVGVRSGTRPTACGASDQVAQLRHDYATFGIEGQTAQLIGLELLDGVTVWHLHAKVDLSASASLMPTWADLSIGASDYHLRREVLEYAYRSNGTHYEEHAAITYSRYGEPVDIMLPSECRG